MRILVVGAGATGGYFGGRLEEAGRDVTFLVRPGRAEVLRAGGLRIRSPHGDVTLAPRLTTPGNIDGPYDVVLLAVKAYGLAAAIEDFAPAVGPETMIVPLLNGMRHIDALVERFGQRTVLGGVCFVATSLDEDGGIVQLAQMQEIAYGDRSEPDAARLGALDEALSGAGFATRLSRNIVARMWEKWVFLAALGVTTCLMRGSIGDVEAVAGPGFATSVLDECVAVAAAAGFPVRAESYDNSLGMLTGPGSGLASSMYRDLTVGNPVEADHIVGDLVERAARHGVAVPLLDLTRLNLAVYEHRTGR